MYKQFRLLWCMLLLTLTTGYALAATDESGRRFIYLTGPDMESIPPIAANAAQWERNRMYETAPGSNVYEIVKDFDCPVRGAYIRFYSDLADGVPDGVPASDLSACNRMNVIQPKGENLYAKIKYMPNSLFYTDDMAQSKYADVDQYYELPDPANYLIHVDLNNNSLTVIPQWSTLYIVNEEFSDTRLHEYPSSNNLAKYIPAGDLKFRIYRPYYKKWDIPNAEYGPVLTTGAGVTVHTTDSDTQGEPFTVPGWTGGVLKYNAGNLDILPDVQTFTPMDLPAIYIAGNCTGWMFETITRESGSEAVYKYEFPAGTTEFKLLTRGEWGAPEIGSNGQAPTISDGMATYGLLIKEEGALANHLFSEATSTPMTLTVNLSTGKVTIEASPALNLISAASSGTVYRTDLFVQTPDQAFEPWGGCSDNVLSCFPTLHKRADGSWKGKITIPYAAKSFKVRFISALGENGTPNTVIAPPSGSDQMIASQHVVAETGEAYSSYAQLPADQAGYWTFDCDYYMWLSNVVNFTVTDNSVHFSVTVGGRPKIYVVGDVNGWDVEDNSIQLKQTDTYGYYGSFEAAPGSHSFRFYTVLGDWESNSYGSSEDDWSSVTWDASSSSQFNHQCVAGKGNYNIENWPGGTMYVYANLYNQDAVIISKEPIAEAGNVIADKPHVYAYVNGEYDELYQRADGLFYTQSYLRDKDGVLDLRFFTKKLPISPEEAEWAGSYAFSASSTEPLSFDECGVAEFGFTVKDNVNTEQPNKFLTPENFQEGGHYIVVDMENKRVYIERTNHHMVLFGDVTNGEIPTYATRAQFKDYIIPRTGKDVEFPAGNPSFVQTYSLLEVSESMLNNTQVDATLENGVFTSLDQYGRTNLVNRPVVLNNWQGGKVIVTPFVLADLSQINEVTMNVLCTGTDETSTVTLLPAAPGSRVFKGKCNFQGSSNVSFRAFTNLENPLVMTSITGFKGTGGIANEGANILVPTDGQISAPVSYISGFPYRFPTLVGTGEMDVTLDLNNHTFTATIPEANEGSVYEVVSENSSDLDGVTGYPSSTQEDAVVVSASAGDTESTGEQEIVFNLTTPAGDVIAPAEGSDTEVAFDENGTWNGSFAVTPAAAPSRTAARRAASGEAVWRVKLPAGASTKLFMMVDEANSRIVLQSSAHNNGFYIVPKSEADAGKYGIEHIDAMTSTTLKPVADGIYEAAYTIPGFTAGQPFEFYLCRSCDISDGVAALLPSVNSMTLTPEAPEAQLLARESGYGWSPFSVTTPAAAVKLRYDSKNLNLSASYDPTQSGVENVSADVDKLTIAPSTGCIIVTADREATVAVYTLTGQLVVMRTVAPGTTSIALAPGLYIANGSKLMVR